MLEKLKVEAFSERFAQGGKHETEAFLSKIWHRAAAKTQQGEEK